MVSTTLLRPDVDREHEILLFADLIDYSLDYMALDRSEARNVRMAKRAARAAMQELVNCYNWPYFNRRKVLRTDEDFEDGTFEYDHATRTVTISGNTENFPTWAGWGMFQSYSSNAIQAQFKVERRTGNTTLILRRDDNPGEDVAAGEDYKLVRPFYPLPPDLKAIAGIYNETDDSPVHPVTWSESSYMASAEWSDANLPFQYQMYQDGSQMGSKGIELLPPPDSEYLLTIKYRATVWPLRIDKWESTVSVSGTTATFTETLPASVVGSVIRFSSDNDPPTAFDGSLAVVEDNPWAYQRSIVERTDATHAELDSTPGTLTSVACVVSDPVDIDIAVMREALLIGTLAKLGRLLRVVSEGSFRIVTDKHFREEIIRAREAADSGNIVSSRWTYRPFPNTDYQSAWSV